MKTKHIFILTTIVSLLILESCASSKQFQVKHDYKLDHVNYQVDDNQIRQVLEKEKDQTAFKKGQSLDKKTFEKERNRIERIVKRKVDPDYDKKYITFQIDTTLTDNSYSVETIVRRNDR